MFIPNISKEEVNLLPVVEFTGEMMLVDTPQKVDIALAELNGEKIVGLDTETRPSFKRGIYYKVSLLQISTEKKCYLFRLNKIGFPEGLSMFIANENILKIGLSLRDDFKGLSKQKKFKPKGFIDIQNIAREYGILELSLQKIFAIIFGQKISKSQRLTNWENDILTEQQQRYAATDAWASLLIYLTLSTEEKLTKKEIEKLVTSYNEEKSDVSTNSQNSI